MHLANEELIAIESDKEPREAQNGSQLLCTRWIFIVSDDPVNLDDHRSAVERVSTNIRRHSLKEFEADQESLRRRQEELETQLLAEPAETWAEAAVKAQYLIRLYAQTTEGQDSRRQKLIKRALGDLALLMDRESEKSAL